MVRFRFCTRCAKTIAAGIVCSAWLTASFSQDTLSDQDTARSDMVEIKNVIKKNDAHYVRALQMLHERMRLSEYDKDDYVRFYNDSRTQWLGARFGADSSTRGERQVQAAWPKGLSAPAPGIGIAAWILALYSRKFGIVGISHMSWQMAHEAIRRKGLILVELEDGFRWVENIEKKRRNYVMMLSDSVVLQCGKKPRDELCAPNKYRQWLVIFPYAWQACSFEKNSRALAKNAGSKIFWYAEFLEQYLVLIGKPGNSDPLPQVPRHITCN